MDQKGRLVIPSRFREIINRDGYSGENGLILTCLGKPLIILYRENYTKIQELVKARVSQKPELLERFSYFSSLSTECSLDKQGRFLIPPLLREYAEINKDVAIIGAGDKIEVWSKEKWDEFESIMKPQWDSITKDLQALGF